MTPTLNESRHSVPSGAHLHQIPSIQSAAPKTTADDASARSAEEKYATVGKIVIFLSSVVRHVAQAGAFGAVVRHLDILAHPSSWVITPVIRADPPVSVQKVRSDN